MRSLSLRQRVVLPIVLGFGVVGVVVSLAAVAWVYREIAGERGRARVVAARFVEEQFRRTTEVLSAVAEGVVRDPPIREALASGDTVALAARARPWMDRPAPRGLAHLHFYASDRAPLLLLRGDGLGPDPGEGRMLAAAGADAPAAGLEEGGVGGELHVRLAAPIPGEDGPIGWVELARDASDLTSRVREVLGVEVVVSASGGSAEGIALRDASGREIGELVVLSEYAGSANDVVPSLLILVAVLVMSASGASWMVLRSFRRHLVAPVEAAGEMVVRATRGEPVEPIEHAGDEMVALTDALNRMVVELGQAQTDQTEILVERALDGVVGVDAAGRTVTWNRQAEEIFGWSREEVLGRDLVERIVPEASRERVRSELARMMQGKPSDWADRRLEAELTARTGVHFPAEISVTPTRTSRGWVVGAFIRDITDRRAAENRIRTSEARYRRLVETANVVPWEADSRTTTVTYVGPQAEALLGYDVEAWYEEGFWVRRLHAEDRDFALRALAEAVNGDGPDSFEYRMTHRDGHTVWVRDVVTAEPGAFGPVVRGFRFDVTTRRNLEDQLSRSLRLEAVGRLAGGVAHDFNNVVTSVLGYADLLLDRLPDDADGRQELREIRRVTAGAGDLTSRLLAFAQQQPLRPRRLALETRLLGMDRMIRRLIGEDIEVSVQVDGASGVVELDPGQFEQIVVNLVLNARDAMPRGGSLVVEVRPRELDEDEVAGSGVEAGAYVSLIVRDSGVGMDAELMDRIFEPFFTTKPTGEATGLGLSTVYGVVRQAGGFVDVDSAPGKGTVVHVHLPRVIGPADAADSDPVDARLDGTEHILLAEDDPQIRELAREALTRRGYSVVPARNGQELLQRAREPGASFDLVVADVIMPVMGGVEAVDRLRHEVPGIRVLFISGYAPDSLFSPAQVQSGVNFLAKPFTPDDLVRRIRTVLDREAAREVSVAGDPEE